ncbi:hypothetical protein JCM8097_005026 [Rhodosporidiobolus ruineniae]
MFGLQLVWSCEMAQASPFLLSLGVSKSMMSVVFLAGPLSGLIVQPLVGFFSDSCKSPLGRRRPFIIGGCIMTAISVTTLGWSKDIAGIFAEEGGKVHQHLAIACAVISVYVIDFAVNVVQAMDRSLLIDVVSPSQQPAANAWASRMFGFGAVFGYWFGGIDLVWLTRGWLGSEQLKVLTLFTSFFLLLTHAITCSCVQERVLISREDEHSGSGPVAALEEIYSTIRTLPRPIRQVFDVQFTSWIGWFPILFFSTTWVAEIYVRNSTADGAGGDFTDAPQTVRDAATRAGTHAMLWHSIISLTTSILVPPLVDGADSEKSASDTAGSYRRSSSPSARWQRFLPTLPFKWLSLPLLWTFSNGVFACLLLGTWFADSVAGASFILAAAGFSWSITNWAPFAILGDLILRLGSSPPLASPNNSTLMLNRASTDQDPALYDHASRDGLSPIPEEAYSRSASAIGSQNGDYKRTGTQSPPFRPSPRAAPPGPITFPDDSPSPFSTSSQFSIGDDSDLPFTPTTSASNYFDAASSVGGPSLPSSRPESFASYSPSASTVGSRTPTLTASPHSSPRAIRSGGNGGGGRDRHDSFTSERSAASSTFAYPPNHGSVGLDLLGEPYGAELAGGSPLGARGPRGSGEFFGADPYAYRGYYGRGGGGVGGGSSSTVHLPRRGSAGGGAGVRGPEEEGGGEGDDTVLQIQVRHSDSFDLSASERASLDRDLHGHGHGEETAPSTVRPGAGFEGAPGGGAGGRRGSMPRILVGGGDDGEETEEWNDGLGEDEEALAGGGNAAGGGGGGDQTGVILGCHNIFLVLPQLLVTGLSSIIFALLAPHHSVLGSGSHASSGVSHPKTPLGPSSNSTTPLAPAGEAEAYAQDVDQEDYRVVLVRGVGRLALRGLARFGEAMVERRQERGGAGEEGPAGASGGWDALGLIFRLGGISAIFSTYVCFRLWRDRQRAAERSRAVGRGYRLG